jgi:XTP/dITP diphosphohydrolase
MPSLIFATHNKNKVFEAKAILKNKIELVSLDELGFYEDIAETGQTFEANAALKAEYISQHYQLPCIADDSGLVVEALNGAPGLYSARYAGMPKNDENNNTLLLKNLNGISHRAAYFITVIAYARPLQTTLYFEGRIRGKISYHPKGTNGFGYDPLFIPDGYAETFAELDQRIKNTLSHRALALEQLGKYVSTRA